MTVRKNSFISRPSPAAPSSTAYTLFVERRLYIYSQAVCLDMSESLSLAAESARLSLKRSRLLFDNGNPTSVYVPSLTVNPELARRRRSRMPPLQNELANVGTSSALKPTTTESRALIVTSHKNDDEENNNNNNPQRERPLVTSTASALALLRDPQTSAAAAAPAPENRILTSRTPGSSSIYIPTPTWHAPWKLATVLSSHLGWVRCLALEPTHNRLLASGSADRTIKIWNFPKASVGADDALQLTLTGHISAVRALAFSPRHPYLFSCAEDKKVLCWDLETNQVVRHYHGHLSGVYALQLHPTLDLLVTGGRDAVARVWDMRTKTAVHTLSGHGNTVGAILVHPTHPQIVTGSYDTTIKLWDLVAGKTVTTLTHHNKSVRALVSAASLRLEHTFASGAADAVRKWQAKDGKYLQKMTTLEKPIINALALNDDGVLVSGGDNGSMQFWDYQTGHNFQSAQSQAQPGSLEAENGIMALAFDGTGSRLITGETDKTIKIWKQDEDASELSHPVDMAAWRKKCIAEAKERY
jgi:pleiotropic regulator 1